MTHSPHDAELRAAARHFTRRRFLTVTSAAAALAFATNLPAAHAAEADPASITTDPFTLGVASGDPLPDSVVLWTRLAPVLFEPGNGLPALAFPVSWEIARDDRFGRVVRRGTTLAHPEFNHTVHVDVRGLDADREYFYRFRTGPWTSPAGRTRTAPPTGADNSRVRFAVVSCQYYIQGYWTAYRHLADDDVQAVFHCGDYLYEGPVNSAGGIRAYPAGTLPDAVNHEADTLARYRLHYALYKSDPDLRAAHAAHPFVVTWDDHETENNYADEHGEGGVPPEEFLVRRAAAYRAYWENMPLRAPQQPDGPDMRLYRRMHFGRLAQFDVLDTRQYRSVQAPGENWQPPHPAAFDPARSMTGDAQERWLIDGWRRSAARWNVVPQQVVFSERRDQPTPDYLCSHDSWDGYRASRERILAGAETAGVDNLVVLTGDVHVHYGFDIKRDFTDPASRTLGVELVGTSISSGGNGSARPANYDRLFASNAHLKYYNGQRGYLRVTLDPSHLRADYLTVPQVTTPGAPIAVAASYVSEAGHPGLVPG
ncbi:Alkaline phosphatase D [Streptomyces sp. RB5]|uniref:Alkaline phosphatase D n=1 Tax=Streptomyces smaragdinus TaxID=2585196 RepID=A0A7K0CCN0_9ACTN|nr:alkaline phosphatase D family protein [Streptomyces smaragdinus]MQY11209.1 Alkaline phosphatase D [Streptomyces smaragdinus]